MTWWEILAIVVVAWVFLDVLIIGMFQVSSRHDRKGNGTMKWKLTPSYFDYGGRPVYDVGPIEDGNKWLCPNCGEELDFTPTHDRFHEGFAPEAVPDVYRCLNCDYSYVE